MSWDDVFTDRYEERSADMSADIPFYTALATEADGPLVELALVGDEERVARTHRRRRPAAHYDVIDDSAE